MCFATSGPGATNLTTGIATAYYDSSPVVFITCNVTENLLGKDAFQEVDITGIAMPITKATYLVRDPQTIPDIMREAFAVAVTELSVVWLPEEVSPPEQPINAAESASAAKMIGTDFLNFIIHQHSF